MIDDQNGLLGFLFRLKLKLNKDIFSSALNQFNKITHTSMVVHLPAFVSIIPLPLPLVIGHWSSANLKHKIKTSYDELSVQGYISLPKLAESESGTPAIRFRPKNAFLKPCLFLWHLFWGPLANNIFANGAQNCILLFEQQ